MDADAGQDALFRPLLDRGGAYPKHRGDFFNGHHLLVDCRLWHCRKTTRKTRFIKKSKDSTNDEVFSRTCIFLRKQTISYKMCPLWILCLESANCLWRI